MVPGSPASSVERLGHAAAWPSLASRRPPREAGLRILPVRDAWSEEDAEIAMAAALYKEFIPEIPETDFDFVTRSALAALPPGASATAVFGRSDCPPGAVVVEPVDCCWDFRKGAASVIDRLSLGDANVWRVNWMCEPPETVAGAAIPVDSRHEEIPAIQPPVRRAWFVRYDDVGLAVFPTEIAAILHGETGVTHIPAGTAVGRLAYSPNGLRAFAPGNLTYAVANALAGFDVLFDCMEQAESRELPIPEYFLGDAPEKRMCHFLRRFDFDVIDNGEIGASIVAPVDRVRAALHRNRDRWQPLLARAGR